MKSLIKTTTEKSQWTQRKDLVEFMMDSDSQPATLAGFQYFLPT